MNNLTELKNVANAANAAGVAAGVAWDTWAAADAVYCNAVIPSNAKAAKAAADAAWANYADALEVAVAEWSAVIVVDATGGEQK